MADWRDLSNEQLVTAHGAAGDPEGHYTAADLEDLGAELLRRLSAGNPQAEKVQITHDCDPDCQERAECDKAGSVGHWMCGKWSCGHPKHHVCECPKGYEAWAAALATGRGPERSDGRIQGERAELIEGDMRREQDILGQIAGLPEAQRSAGRILAARGVQFRDGAEAEDYIQSAGRIEAGSEQPAGLMNREQFDAAMGDAAREVEAELEAVGGEHVGDAASYHMAQNVAGLGAYGSGVARDEEKIKP